MNLIWPVCISAAFLISFANGTTSQTAAAMFDAAKKSTEVVLSLTGLMCFWSGILEIADRSGVTSKAEKFFSPIIHRLFPKLKRGGKASKLITANITANILGMGNAATPAGIAAMEELDKINPNQKKPSSEMCIFTVINTASLQIIPTTIISIRAAYNATHAADILPAVWISSLLSLIAAVISMKIILCFKRNNPS